MWHSHPHGLGDAVAPHGPGGGLVGEHAPGVPLHVGAGVDLGEGPHALGHHAVAVGGVGPLVGEALDLPGGEGPVGPDPGDDVGADGVADPVVDEGLLTLAVDLHQPAPQLGGEPGAQGLVEGVLLVAEAAADVGFDDSHLAPGDAQGLAADPADDVGDLGGGDHGDPPALHVGGADVVLDVAVLDGGGVVPALHLDEARLFAGGFVVAAADLGVGQDVARVLLVELGRVGLHGLLHVQDKGQLLIGDLYQPGGLGRGHLVFRHHHRHVVAVVADMAAQQQPVRHVLVGGVRAPGVARRGEVVLRHVEAGEDLHHPGDGLRLAGVDGGDHAVGHGGVDQAGHQGAAVAQIVGVFGPARGLVKGVHPDPALAYAAAHGTSASFTQYGQIGQGAKEGPALTSKLLLL